MSFTYADILDRLETIEYDISERQGTVEDSAKDYFSAKRDFEKAWADAYVQTEGTVEERRQKTIIAIYRSDAYKALVKAEAAYEASRAVMRALETRASIGQSLLRAHTREAQQGGQQPSWSPRHFGRQAA